ncbi:MAG TPA: Tad domain-containing protein [Tepidisphaeraceae bacterium]|jgi:hypothetical protein|nr:Tad domain-containing protein [Tepidisphaeraceae bacterium]
MDTAINKSVRPNVHQARRPRRGAVLIYAALMMTAFCGICSLAVDYGRVQMVKTELQRMADATARGYCELYNVNGSWPTTTNTYASKLDSTTYNPVTSTSTPSVTITKGYWKTSTSTWSTSSGSGKNPAAKVTMSVSVPLTWGAVIGFSTITVHATATAETIPATSLSDTVLATANPFLSGMSNGSEASNTNPHNSPDYAPAESPTNSGLSITSGQSVNFAAISGTATNDPGDTSYQPDGEDGEGTAPDNIGHNNISGSESGDYTAGFNNENGIADANIPINALVGVFLGPSQPSTSDTPANLDFSSTTSRNFTTLYPALQQVFFIGDGQTDGGATQNFIAPDGATRLYLATWDFYQWNNNVGSRTVQITIPAGVQLVQ